MGVAYLVGRTPWSAPAPWPACREYEGHDASRGERDEGVPWPRGHPPGGPPHSRIPVICPPLLPNPSKRHNVTMPTRLLPLFPLPVVVFPRTPLPLHIFEERHK